MEKEIGEVEETYEIIGDCVVPIEAETVTHTEKSLASLGTMDITPRAVHHTVLCHKFYRPKWVSISHTHTVQFFLKAWTARYGHFYGCNTVYGSL
jgi:hypothetical protein